MYKIQGQKGELHNFKPISELEDRGFDYTIITSYASDIDMKDVETNQAWKFKIVDGELQYDQEKIKAKLNKDVIAKRQARYQAETDPILLEIIYEDKVNGKTNGELVSLKQELKAKKEQIKLDLPKV